VFTGNAWVCIGLGDNLLADGKRFIDWVEDCLGRWTVKYRWWIILLTLPTVGLASLGIGRLRINRDTRAFFGEENPQYQALKAAENTFSKEQTILFVVAPKDGNVFTRQTLTALFDLTQTGWQLPHSTRVNSLCNFQHTRGQDDELIVEHLVNDPNGMSAEQIEETRKTALSQRTIVNRLISPSGHVAGVLVHLSMPEGQPQATPEVAQAARETMDYFQDRYPGIDFYLTGSVMIDQAFGEASEQDLRRLVPVMLLTMSALIGLTLRSFFGVFATIAVIVLSMLTALGLTGWLGIALTAASVSGPGLILTLAVADSVHILTTMFHMMRQGLSKHDAIARALKINLRAVFLTSATTVVGFLSMNFSESPPFRDLGNMVAIGVTAAFLCSITLLPALMAVLPTSARAGQSNPIRTGCDRLADFTVRRQKPLLWSMLIAGAGLSVGIMRIELDDNFLTYFDRSFTFRRATDFLIENLAGWDVIEYRLNAREPGGIADPEYLVSLDRFAQWYRRQPKVTSVYTVSDTIMRLNQDMHGGDERHYRIPDTRELAAQYLLLYEMSLPFGHDLNDQIDVGRSSTRFVVMLESMSAKELRHLDDAAQQWLQTNAPDHMQAPGTGLSLVWAHITERNIVSMLKGSFMALLLISIIMTLALRSLRLGLLSLIPNLLPPIMAFGIWGFLRGQVGLALSVIVAMTIGIVVDDTVHFLSKYDRARREDGMSPSQAVRHAFHTVGTAMWVTTVALVAGFMVLTLSHYRMSSEMGLMCAITIAAALLMDFLLLPTLLLKTDRRPDNLVARQDSALQT
jgi:predicted RND superfamily exporter protein